MSHGQNEKKYSILYLDLYFSMTAWVEDRQLWASARVTADFCSDLERLLNWKMMSWRGQQNRRTPPSFAMLRKPLAFALWTLTVVSSWAYKQNNSIKSQTTFTLNSKLLCKYDFSLIFILFFQCNSWLVLCLLPVYITDRHVFDM